MSRTSQSVWIGYDPRENDAFAVARHSARRNLIAPAPVRAVNLAALCEDGYYWRPTKRENGRIYDVLSAREDYDGAMSTEFAISRFLVPRLAHAGWALFMDADVLVRHNLDQIFQLGDPSKAVMVVKHDHQPTGQTKMDSQLQTRYARKNWSSVMLFNVDHPAHEALTVELINSVPGRDLHAFCWLADDLIGELSPEWNYLVGHTKAVDDPAIVHFTDGVPSMPGYEKCEYAQEWHDELRDWAA